MRRAVAAGLVGMLTMVTAVGPARGDEGGFGSTGLELLHGRWGAFSGFYGVGSGALGVTALGLEPRLTGLRYTERKGFVTGLFFALMNTVAGGLAASSPKSVERYRSGNWIVTKTTYRSEAEKQAILDRTAESSSEMMGAEDQSFELDLYMTRLPGGGESSGYKLNMFFGAEFGEHVMLDVGMGFGSLVSRFERDERQVALTHSYFGMPFKLNVAAGPALVWFQWDWNWLGEWSGHEPQVLDEPGRYKRQLSGSHLELGMTTALFGRVMLQGSVTTPALDSGDFGFRASAGLRF